MPWADSFAGAACRASRIYHADAAAERVQRALREEFGGLGGLGGLGAPADPAAGLRRMAA